MSSSNHLRLKMGVEVRIFLPSVGVAATQQRLSRACLDDSVARSTGFTAMWHTLFLSTLFQGDLALSSQSLLRWTQSSVVDDAPQVDVYLSLQRPQLAMCHPRAGSAATTTSSVESTPSFLGDNIGIKVREMNWNNIEVKLRKNSTPTRNAASEPGSCLQLDVWKKWARVQALGGKHVVSQKKPAHVPSRRRGRAAMAGGARERGKALNRRSTSSPLGGGGGHRSVDERSS